ncbi:MAG: PP2C family protein-serine/threonine phosphatase [Solirubrobacteraceae bacterium]
MGTGHDPAALLEEPRVSRLAERLVSEAQDIAGSDAALYVVDLEGRTLRRVGAGDGFPEEIGTGQLIGPELPDRGIQSVGDLRILPLRLRGRAVAAMAFVREPTGDLSGFAPHAAAALELAERYTDVFARARRREPTTAAAELQQELMPPRIVPVEGAELAGSVIPAYDVGGDWLDMCATHDGAWLAVADAVGKGAQASAIGAIGLAGYRAARRAGEDLAGAAASIHEAIAALDLEAVFVSAVLAEWDAGSRTVRWLRCGGPAPYAWSAERGLRVLPGGDGALLGLPRIEPPTQPASYRLAPGERLILVSDGVLERIGPRDEQFGEEGLRRALAGAGAASAPELTAAVLDAVHCAGDQPLRDDATVLAIAPT